MTVSRARLGIVNNQDNLPEGVQARVLYNDEPALLPDLASIEARIAEAMAAQAA